MKSYDFYADMYATHSEIGYLLALGLLLLAFDGGVAVLIGRWPPADVYLVPGVVAYGEVPVVWGRQPPRGPAADGSAHPTLIQVSLPAAHDPPLASPDGAGKALGDGSDAGAGSRR